MDTDDWGKWNSKWHFISTLFCWHLFMVETLIGQLHEACDVQSCLLVLKLVVQRKEWSRSLTLCSAQVCGASRLWHGNWSWSLSLELILVLCLYQHVSEPYHKLLSKAFIQRSDIPHQRLSKQHLLFEIPEKKYINTVFIWYTKKQKRFSTNTCMLHHYNFFL